MAARTLLLGTLMVLALVATVPAMASAHIIVFSGSIGCTALNSNHCNCDLSKNIWGPGPEGPLDPYYMPGGEGFNPTDPDADQHMLNSVGSVTLSCYNI